MSYTYNSPADGLHIQPSAVRGDVAAVLRMVDPTFPHRPSRPATTGSHYWISKHHALSLCRRRAGQNGPATKIQFSEHLWSPHFCSIGKSGFSGPLCPTGSANWGATGPRWDIQKIIGKLRSTSTVPFCPALFLQRFSEREPRAVEQIVSRFPADFSIVRQILCYSVLHLLSLR